MAPSSYTRLSFDEPEDPVQSSTAVNEVASDSGSHSGGQQPKRPPTYYEDGPFDAPSSDSEEDELLEKHLSISGPQMSPGLAETGFGMHDRDGLIVGKKEVRNTLWPPTSHIADMCIYSYRGQPR